MKILILSDRSFEKAPRIIREIEALKKDYEISTSNFFKYNLNKIIKPASLALLIDRIFNRFTRIIKGNYYFDNLKQRTRLLTKYYLKNKFDIVIIHEPELLPYVISLKKFGVKVIFNAHEYHPQEFEDDPHWIETHGKYYTYLYQNYLQHVDLLVNVCYSIAEKCRLLHGVNSIVIPNAALYHGCKPFINEKGPIRMIYHGIVNPSRRIEEMIYLMDKLGPGFTLDLMILKDDLDYFEIMAKEVAIRNNVHIIDPVPFNKIIPTINKYDVGLYILAPTNYNNSITLPNKLFEFIQANLCIAIGPSIEMKPIVEEFHLGIIGDDFTASTMYEQIKNLTMQQINQYKENAHIAANQLSAERYMKVYHNAVCTLTGNILKGV